MGEALLPFLILFSGIGIILAPILAAVTATFFNVIFLAGTTSCTTED
jgi:hypothetical protein